MQEYEIAQLLAVKFAAPAYAFLPQVRNGTGYSRRQTRTVDALAFSLYPSRGLDLYGFEIKRTKADLKSELKEPDKAEDIAKYCDYWYLVVEKKKIIENLVLPGKWGVMACDGGKVKVIKEAEKLEVIPLDKLMICAIMRRVQETKTPEAMIGKERDEAYKKGFKDGAKSQKGYHRYDLEKYKDLKEKVEKFERISGVKITHAYDIASNAAMYRDIINIVMNAEKNGGFLSHVKYLLSHAEDFACKARAIAGEIEKIRNPKNREVEKSDNQTLF